MYAIRSYYDDQRQGNVVEHAAIHQQTVILEDDADLAAYERDLALRQARITSYNVCYTKLLRAGFEQQGAILSHAL